MKELICIVCPKGCHLKIYPEDGYRVTGNQCAKGEEYGKKELINPTRVVTSTVKIEGAEIARLPVKTSGDIPKASVMQAMELLNGILVKAPVQVGDIIVPDIAGTGVNFVATRSLPKI